MCVWVGGWGWRLSRSCLVLQNLGEAKAKKNRLGRGWAMVEGWCGEGSMAKTQRAAGPSRQSRVEAEEGEG